MGRMATKQEIKELQILKQHKEKEMIIVRFEYGNSDLTRLGKYTAMVTFRKTATSDNITVTGYGNMKHKALENAMQKIAVLMTDYKKNRLRKTA